MSKINSCLLRVIISTGFLVIFMLTNFKTTVTDLNTKLASIVTKMNTIVDTKTDKTSVDENLKLKADNSTIGLQLNQLLEDNKGFKADNAIMKAQLITLVTDVAYSKGQEDKRRELTTKNN